MGCTPPVRAPGLSCDGHRIPVLAPGESIVIDGPRRSASCPNCGAPARSHVCDYCRSTLGPAPAELVEITMECAPLFVINPGASYIMEVF